MMATTTPISFDFRSSRSRTCSPGSFEAGSTVTYQIVGDDEADIKEGKISVSSPIARALIGKTAGEEVEVKAPGGIREYEVLDVRYL